MEHNELTQYATERYLLEEMPEAERDQFEEHFFSCMECAAEVKAGARMMAAGRAVVREHVTPVVVPFKKKTSWQQWFPQTAAASVLAASMGWFGASAYLTRPVITIAEVIQVNAETELERGPADVQQAIVVGEDAILNFQIPTDDGAPSYVYTVRDAGGKTLFTRTKSLEEASTKAVSLSLRGLPRGSYLVVMEGVREDGKRFPVTSIKVQRD